MKIAFYALRDFDELAFVKKFSQEYGIGYVWTAAYPDESNLDLATGCDAISATPCRMTDEMLETWHGYGVRSILTRSIGFDHVPLVKARELGMTVSNTPYPTDCVADYAIMLMLMCLRQMKQIMVRAEAQDFTLKNKMGRNLEACRASAAASWRTTSTKTRPSNRTPATWTWTRCGKKRTSCPSTSRPTRPPTTW